MQYFLAIDGAKSGALTRFEVREKIEKGEVSKSTLGWVRGMEQWLPLGEFEEFNEVFDPPPPRELTEAEGGATNRSTSRRKDAPVVGPRGAPWLRLCARGIDVILLFLAFATVVSFLLPGLAEKVGTSWVWQLLANSGMILIWCFLEALLLSTWGYTPGKALLKIAVRDSEGNILSYKVALQRALLVWVKGLALMIVWITPIAMMIAHARLMIFGNTTWDRDLRLQVNYGRPGQIQLAVAAAIYMAFAFLVFQAIQMHLDQLKEQEAKEGEGAPGDSDDQKDPPKDSDPPVGDQGPPTQV